MKTLEQRRAANALARVNALAGESDDFKKSYRSYVERLGPAIIMNGLGQALATELAAAGNSDSDAPAHGALYRSVHEWLCRADGGVYPKAADLLVGLVERDESHYLHAQGEAIAWLVWHKKFCRAKFPRREREG